jgi:hypothetical protein
MPAHSGTGDPKQWRHRPCRSCGGDPRQHAPYDPDGPHPRHRRGGEFPHPAGRGAQPPSPDVFCLGPGSDQQPRTTAWSSAWGSSWPASMAGRLGAAGRGPLREHLLHLAVPPPPRKQRWTAGPGAGGRAPPMEEVRGHQHLGEDFARLGGDFTGGGRAVRSERWAWRAQLFRSGPAWTSRCAGWSATAAGRQPGT